MSDREPFSTWITRPEVLVALAAVLIGVCGLFVAVYETSLTRKGQRASVWPHVEVAPSFGGGGFTISVINSGVGPARIEAASVVHSGERRQDWEDVIVAVTGRELSQDAYTSLINGRVLPAGEREVIFRVAGDPLPTPLVTALREQVSSGVLDVTVCYCSVFDECWVATMQEVVARSRGVAVSREERSVRECRSATVSGI
jgi:hypothetical protein